MTGADPYDLQRFVAAQEPVFPTALAELRAGRKRTHWMWFIFPQLRGLGRSPTATYYGIGSLDEARAYLAHPVLGPRLRACAQAVAAITDRTAEQILGGTDSVKLRSSMTLFARAAPQETVFRQVLERFFAGGEDPATVQRL